MLSPLFSQSFFSFLFATSVFKTLASFLVECHFELSSPPTCTVAGWLTLIPGVPNCNSRATVKSSTFQYRTNERYSSPFTRGLCCSVWRYPEWAAKSVDTFFRYEGTQLLGARSLHLQNCCWIAQDCLSLRRKRAEILLHEINFTKEK